MTYRPMTIANLAAHLARHTDEKIRWKYVWEFLEEYRWESAERQPDLLGDEPPSTGEERWDALLAALAEHLTAQLDQAPPAWTRTRVLAHAVVSGDVAVQAHRGSGVGTRGIPQARRLPLRP
jgi:hypothetical protein